MKRNPPDFEPIGSFRSALSLSIAGAAGRVTLFHLETLMSHRNIAARSKAPSASIYRD
jgi:hypothetical protein